MGHILDPQAENSPLYQEPEFLELETASPLASSDFWDQYFRFQDIAKTVTHQSGRVAVDITNNSTGESFHFDGLALKETRSTD